MTCTKSALYSRLFIKKSVVSVFCFDKHFLLKLIFALTIKIFFQYNTESVIIDNKFDTHSADCNSKYRHNETFSKDI